MNPQRSCVRAVESLECRRLLATITGKIVHDIDYDGVYDASDPPLPEGTASVFIDANNDGLFNSATELKATANFNGDYAFNNVAAGRHIIRPILGADQRQTLPAPGAARVVDVAAGQTTAVADPFTIAQYYTLYFETNEDRNRNGVHDATDIPATAMRVWVDYNNNGAVDIGEPSNQTDSYGIARVSNVKTGTWPVRVALDNTWSPVIKRSTIADVAIGSGFVANSTVSLSSRYGFTGSSIVSTIRLFTFHIAKKTGVINYYAFNDLDNDGYQDAGEGPLAGAGAYIDLDRDGVVDANEPVKYTLANGYYPFEVYPSEYLIRGVPPFGYRQTSPTANAGTVVTVGGTEIKQANFGFSNTYRIAGTVYVDANKNGQRDSTEYAIATGQTVYLDTNNNRKLDASEQSMTVTSDGFWFNVPAGAYNVRYLPAAGWVQSQPNPQVEMPVVVPGTTNPTTWLYFGAYQVFQNAVSGYVYRDANANGTREADETSVPPLASVYLDLDNDSTWDSAEPTYSVGSDGIYVIPLTQAGTYTVRVRSPFAPTWYPTSPGGHTVNFVPGQSITNRNFGFVPGASIYGTMFDDANANGVRDTGETGLGPNYLVYLDTDNDGVFDANETSVPTSADGTFSFSLLAPGTYNVRQVVPSGYRQVSPAANGAQVVTLKGTNGVASFANTKSTTPSPAPQTLQAETATLSGGTVKATNHAGYTGTGFADYGGNGSAVQWTLNWSAAGNAKLDFRYANGSTGNRPLTIYVNGVSAGTVACAPTGAWTTWKTISLTAALKAGSNTIKAVAGAASGANVDSLTVNSTTTTPTPPTPPSPTTGSIGGYTFNDSNKNGVLDTKESKASGKTVFLDTNNNGKLDSGEKSLVTDASGAFNFTGLAAGTYSVRRVFPTGYTYSTPLRNIVLGSGQVISGVTIGSKTV